MSKEQFKVGDVVRVIDADGFRSDFAKKIKDRDAVVQWVGPDAHGGFKNQMFVLFQKRNGRGKEFRERMYFRDCVKVAASEAQP